MDLVNNDETGEGLFIRGLEYDLELRPGGDAFTRSYRVTGETSMETPEVVDNDNFSIEFTPGTPRTEEMPSLYSHKKNANGSIVNGTKNNESLAAVFEAEHDPSVNIAYAQFTFKRPSNAGSRHNIYSIYNQASQRYLTNYASADTLFSTTLRNTMRIVYEEGRGYLISKPNNIDDETSGTRYVIYDTQNHTFNANTGYGASDAGRYKYGLSLLKKLTAEEVAATDEDVINFGDDDSTDHCYVEVTGDAGIEEAGRKYLIAYKVDAEENAESFAEGGYVILYPDNGLANHSKLIYDTHEADVAVINTLKITPKAETTDPIDLTINNITYHITVKPESLMVPKGGAAFVENVTLNDVDLGDTTLVSKTAATEDKKALFDCNEESNGNLNGYSTTPNWDANVADAELIITKADENNEHYYIYSPLEKNYLNNTGATAYFAATTSKQELKKVVNNGDSNDVSFEIIRRDTTQNGRYVYFYYGRMGFDALSTKNSSWEAQGDFGFEILKKKDGNLEDATDPIPGYERVTDIESGETYLITEYYTEQQSNGTTRDVIIVLYPRNGITQQSKMYATTTVNGVRIEAGDEVEEGDTVDITIDGVTYRVEIEAECQHGYTRTRTSVESTCLKKGSSGDEICSHCHKVLVAGQETPTKNHDWPTEWTQVRAASINKTTKTVTDGLERKVCSGGEESLEQEISGEKLLLDTISSAIAAAETEKAKTDVYAPETIKALDDAIQAATEAVSGQTPTDVAGKIDALVGLEDAVKPENLVTKTAFDQRQRELQTLLDQAEKDITKTDVYTKDSLADLQAVLDQIDEMKDDEGNLSYVDMQTAITALNGVSLKTIAEAEEEKKVEQLAGDIKTTLDEVKAIAEASGSKDKYTAETWNKFINAYNQLKNKSDAELKAMTSAELETLLSALKTKLVEKPVVTENKLQVNTDHTIGNAVYTVTNAVKNEVVLKKGANTKKFTVPATVSVNGVTCKVVGIGDKAFSGFKNLKNVIIGANVTSIGSKAFFKCVKLNKVTISGAAPTIKKAAFKKTASKVTVKAKKLNKKQKKAFLKVLKKTGKISGKSVVK